MPALQGDFELPQNLLIVGLDDIPKSIVEATKDLEDPNRVDPKKVRADLIASILRWGVKQPVTVRTFNLSKRVRVVVNGRQRVMATRIANEKADPPIKVPYVILPDEKADVTVRVANSGNRPPTIAEKGKDVIALLARGYDVKDIATMFSNGATGEPVTPQTIRNWRDKALGKPKPEGESEGGGSDDGPKRPGIKVVKALLELYNPTEEEPLDEHDAIVRSVLEWVATGDSHYCSPDLKKQIRRVLKAEGS